VPSNTPSRVLCVDDDRDACEMLSVLMRTYGIDATCAQSAAEAWPLIRAKSFDLYMLDGWLPKLDGFDFCRRIRESDSETPILFYSGAAYDTDKQKGLAAGANAYVVKPDIDGLIETTVQLIAKARSEKVSAPSIFTKFRPVESVFSPQFFSLKTASN
jgi:DNA-binding response OmpR family regulator